MSGGRSSDGTDALAPLRRRLDELDEQIVALLGDRFQTCREVALHKLRHDIAVMQPGRVKEVRARYLSRGAALSVPAEFTEAFFELLIGATCRMEDQLIEEEGSNARPTS